MMINKYNFRKVLYVFFVGILSISLIGCSDKNSNNNKNSVKKKDNEIIELSVKELNEIASDIDEAKKYEDKKIKVKGYYWLNINLERDTATKYIQDSPADANYTVPLNDCGLLGEDYIGGEKLELIGNVSVAGSLVDFMITSAVVDGKPVGENGTTENKTITVTKISDFKNNKDYYQGTEVTLYGKIIAKPLENDPNSNSYYLEDVKTKDKIKLNGICHILDFNKLIEKGNPYVIVTFTYEKSHNEGDFTYEDDSKNYFYDETYVSAIEKTDNIKIKEKKKSNKDYSTIVTVEELSNNFDKYDGKLISLEGYGTAKGYVKDGYDPVIYNFLANKNDDCFVKILSKTRDKNRVSTETIYGFLTTHKYLIKGTPGKDDSGDIYLEVDQN